MTEGVPKPSRGPSQEELEAKQQALRERYAAQELRKRDLLDELLILEKERILLSAKQTRRDLVDDLLGESTPERGDKMGKIDREAKENRDKHLESLAKELRGQLQEGFGNSRVKRYFTSRVGTRLITGGPTTPELDRKFRAFVELELNQRTGKHALEFPIDPITPGSPDAIAVRDLINRELKARVDQAAKEIEALSVKVVDKLTEVEVEKLLTQAQRDINASSVEEVKKSRDLTTRVRAHLAEEIEKKYGGKLKPPVAASSAKSAENRGQPGLEELANRDEFKELQVVMRSIRSQFGDADPSAIKRELQKRGLHTAEKTSGYLPHDVIFLAMFEPDEMPGDYKPAQQNIVGVLAKKDTKDAALRSILTTANTLAGMVENVLRIVGYPVDLDKLDGLVGTLEAREGDKIYEQLHILAGVKEDSGLADLLSGSFGDSAKSSNDINQIRKSNTLLQKLAKRIAEVTPAISTAPAPKRTGESAEKKIDPKEVSEWLEGSEELNRLRELAGDSRWHALMKGYKKLDVVKNSAQLQEFLDRHFLQDLTQMTGIFIRTRDNSRYPMEDLRDKGLLKASDAPIGKLLAWLIADPNGPMPSEIVDYYQKMKDEPILYDDPNFSPDVLVRHARIALETAIALAEIMKNEKMNPEPSFEEVMELVKRMKKRFPDTNVNLEVSIPLFAGMKVAEQTEPRRRENMEEPRSVRSMYIVLSPVADRSNFLNDLRQDAVNEWEPFLKLLQEYAKPEATDAFAA